MTANTWNYRIGKKIEEGVELFGLIEVYYTDGVPHSWSDFISPINYDDIKDLRFDFNKMSDAFDKPVFEI